MTRRPRWARMKPGFIYPMRDVSILSILVPAQSRVRSRVEKTYPLLLDEERYEMRRFSLRLLPSLAAAWTITLVVAATSSAAMLASAFTVQGRLIDADRPVDGTMTVRVEPFGSRDGADSLGAPFEIVDVPVDDGFFGFEVDFGPGFFVGDDVYLAVSVRVDGAAEFTQLAPRQQLTATPHALFAANVGIGAVGTDNIAPAAVGRDEIDGNEVQQRVNGGCLGAGAMVSVRADGSVSCREFWSVGGNGGGDARELAVSSGTLRFVVGGFGSRLSAAAYAVESSVVAQIIGAPLTAVNAVVGIDHEVPSFVIGSTIAGGAANSFGSDAAYGVVGGGFDNEANGAASVVSGGSGNSASDDFATVIGGDDNEASGRFAVVAGGIGNQAAGLASFAAGANASALGDNSFVWSGGAGISTVRDRTFIVDAPGGVGIADAEPQAPLHVAGRQLFMQPNVVLEDDAIIEDIDGVLGVYSSPRGTFGSAVVLGETNVSGLIDKWAMVRESTTGNGDSDLKFTFGTNTNYGQNPAQVTLTEDGRAFKADNTSSWNMSSDARIKRDIRPIDGAIQKILALRPVRYRFTDAYLAEHPETLDKERLSFLAQEFREVFPQAVIESDEAIPGGKDGERMLQIDVHPAMMTTIAAMRELVLRVEVQEARIRELERRLGDQP